MFFCGVFKGLSYIVQSILRGLTWSDFFKLLFDQPVHTEMKIVKAVYISVGTLIFCISILVIASENQKIKEKDERDMKKDGK